ncbi:MAG: hypothetical protein Ct9H300mP25_17180 [Acidobacteriota bacterium]|nr:MAG: hypothetical protein Ct9H300mP25_17180 [Acidobacteriota bacterium]
MLALLVRGTENDAMPARHGRFAADVFAVELAVKDSSRVDEGWAYYDFGGGDRARTSAQPFPKNQGCYTVTLTTPHATMCFYSFIHSLPTRRA